MIKSKAYLTQLCLRYEYFTYERYWKRYTINSKIHFFQVSSKVIYLVSLFENSWHLKHFKMNTAISVKNTISDVWYHITSFLYTHFTACIEYICLNIMYNCKTNYVLYFVIKNMCLTYLHHFHLYRFLANIV